MKPTPILKVIGLALLLVGTVLNILMFVAEAWPTYLFFIMMAVGLCFLLLSFFAKRLKTKWQISIALVPFLTTYIFYSISSPSNDIFLIPKGYTGQVIVYYDQAAGQKKEFEGEWRVYKIPSNGQLETQFKLKGNSILLSDSKYFYVDSSNKRLEIKHYCDNCKIKDTLSIQVIFGVLGTDQHGTYQTFSIDKPTRSGS
jgi:energy-coupling factor transporter transmembrane protein EcfT